MLDDVAFQKITSKDIEDHKKVVVKALVTVDRLLREKQYTEANNLLTEITTRQASFSLHLRSRMVKNKLLEPDS